MYENIVRLKLLASDGKYRETDTLDTKGIFRLIESIPSPKAEPMKMWLANLDKERIDEVFDPEIATRDIAKEEKPHRLSENINVAVRGGRTIK